MTKSPTLPLFAEARPDLLGEWLSERNEGVDPKTLTSGSTYNAWWRCKVNPRHEWQNNIRNRVRKHQGCPYCAHQKALPEEMFAKQFPELLLEWHPSKNVGIDPLDLTPWAAKQVWWQCHVNPSHEWTTLLHVRTKDDKGCPYCRGRSAGETNSLGTVFPDIAAEWHPTRNGDVTPFDVTAKNHRQVWWKCKTCMFEWRTAVNQRTISKSGCPICSRDSGVLTSKKNRQEKLYSDGLNYEYDTDDAILFDYREIQSLLTTRTKITSELKTIESALNPRLVTRINYKPYYQRHYVWDNEKQSYFIESVLIGTEIPPLIFYEIGNGSEVIDGRQRFETLLRFENDQFALAPKGLSIRHDLSNKRFSELAQDDKEAFFDAKLRIIQFSIVDSCSVSDRMQDMLKKEIFRRYNSGITPLRQVEVERAVYITDEPTQYLKQKFRQNEFFLRTFVSLFIRDDGTEADVGDSTVEKALQEMRFLLMCANMPILDTRKKDRLQKFYELFSDSGPDTQVLYRDVLRRIKVVEQLRASVDGVGMTVSRYWNEVMYWAAAVIEREGLECSALLGQPTLEKLLALYRENASAYTPVETQFFYREFLARYTTVANFLETEFGLSLEGYLRRRRREQLAPMGIPTDEENADFARIEKQDPTSLSIEDLCRDIKRSKFLLRPAYQRGEVINRAKSSGIIESILLGIKLPPLYVFSRNDGVSEVIDGQQRILSILGFVGQPFLDETGKQVFSEKNRFKLDKLRILDHLNGKSFDELSSQVADRIWDFSLSIIKIDERFNPGFSPVDLFIRLNSRPYPIKENTFEMWNSYVDKEVVDEVKQVAGRYGGWFYVTRNNERMKNEEMIALLSYLYYTQLEAGPVAIDSVVDVFRRTNGINVRIKQKAAVTRMLDGATSRVQTKGDVVKAIKRTDSFIRKMKALLTDKDVSDEGEYLDRQLTAFFNVSGKRYYARKLKDFYALWYITHDLAMEVVLRRRAEIREDIDLLFRSTRIETDDAADASLFMRDVRLFREKYAVDGRKVRLNDEQKRDMLRRQENKCPLCRSSLFITDEIEVDHVVPLAAQGADTVANLQLVHALCNRKKGARNLVVSEEEN